MARRVYWDACVFIGLLSQEQEKIVASRAVWAEAAEGKTEIVTSVFTVAEVIRVRCEGGMAKPLSAVKEQEIIDFLSQKWITRYLLDELIATQARTLVRRHSECTKPADGIHLATALHSGVDEMHTWDGSHLLGLDGKAQKRDSSYLTICTPRVIVTPAPMPAGDPTQILLDGLDEPSS